MLTQILLAFSLISISYSQTNCRTTAWWVLMPFPKTMLQPFLDHSKEILSFNSSNPLASFMKNDEHPVYFEFNQQNQCEQSSLPPWLANLTEQTFVEFKLEIPYLIRQNKTVMLKPLVYQNSALDVGATHLVYGLPSYLATMHADFDNNKYSISYKQGLVEVSFEPLTPSLLPFGSPETTNFSSFVDANISPWLAFPPVSIFSHTKCASNLYKFSQPAHIRPVKMTLNIRGDIFQSIPSGIYTNIGDRPLGAWQIDVQTTITSTYQCP
ncbi:unnamed protein product [Rotaria socialis]|uniref:Uncharacterized protein n=1 Tax=Rotaria socialis TaxID=392032 RepID=A0A817SX48_9BILA|nr:unnamed protein product [Rotaria socialis]